MKKIMAIIIAAAILMGCVITVGAESTTVKKVNLFADVPYAGRMADFTARAGADAKELGYGLYYFHEISDGKYSTVSWYDETTGFYLDEGDRFIKGHEYTQRIGITALTGFKFAYTRYVADNGVSTYTSHFDEVTLNAEDARIYHFTYKNFKEYLYIEKEYSACTDAPAGAIVDEVAVKDVDFPMAGESPDFEITTVGDGYGLLDNDAYAINWYAVKGEYLISLDSDDVFTVGTTYRVDITLKANYGYRFKYDNPETPNMTSAKINGQRVDIVPYYSYVVPVPEKELKISYTFPPCAGDTVSLIEITGVIPPAVGETPSYEAVMLSEACIFSDYEDSKNKNGACWYDYTAGDFVKTTDTFIAGHEYSITFELFAADGYRFDKGNVDATVNGYEAVVRYYSEGDTTHYVEYRFAPCFDGDYIAGVEITNVVPPTPGEKPVYNASVSEGCTITHVDWGWEDIQELMDPEYAFEDGNTYGIFFWVKVEDPDNYRFSDSVTVTVNGITAQCELFDDGYLFVECIFPPCGMGIQYLPGDANTDGTVNLSDVSLILKHIAKWDVAMDADAADVNDDAKINLSDVSLVLKHIAGWNVKLK